MADMAAREGASSARRRQDRQLRAWHRHVRTTVAMELATALHHSAQGPKKRVVEEPREEELPVKHNATSGQNATPPWGVRPAHPLDVSEQPPLVAATCVAAGFPLLGVPSLADAPAEAIDGRTLRYLLKVNLARKKKEEEEQERKAEEEEHEERMLEIHRKVRADEAVTDAEWSAWKAWRGIGSSSSGVKKRKRKKRRKKRLPKSSSSRSARTWCSGQSSTSPLPSMLGVYVPCGYLLIRQSWRRFGRFLRCLGCPGSTRFCIHRNAWSLVHVMRQSTKFFVYMGTDSEVDSPALAGVFNAPDHFFTAPCF